MRYALCALRFDHSLGSLAMKLMLPVLDDSFLGMAAIFDKLALGKTSLSPA
jgi:hypothetical protein